LIPLELVRELEKQMQSLRIGSTLMHRAQKLEKLLGVRRLHLKLECRNPSGTHKDRLALVYALDARSKGIDTMVAATCGNYGAAVAYVCYKLDMKCRIYIPSEFVAPRRAEIERMGASVTVAPGDYEAAVRASAMDAARNRWYDANAGGPNNELGIFTYTFVAREIAKDLGRQPDWVSVPVGNGTCIAGIWNGFRSMSMKPRMLGVSNNNSAVRGVVLGAEKEVPIEDIRITETNEPLAGNVIFDAEEAMAAMVESNGGAVEVPDEELIRAAEIIKKEEGLDILPASAGAVWGIKSLESKNHVFVAVITGKGHFGGE
jgi:threonine synthase